MANTFMINIETFFSLSFLSISGNMYNSNKCTDSCMTLVYFCVFFNIQYILKLL